MDKKNIEELRTVMDKETVKLLVKGETLKATLRVLRRKPNLLKHLGLLLKIKRYGIF